MYEVIGSTPSRTTRVIWMLEELGQPYTHTKVKPHTEIVSKLNPSGKIPVLKDGDAVLTDSIAIMTYLADKHDDMTYPAGTIERARQDGLTNQILDELDSVLWVAMRHAVILPKEHRVPDIKHSLRWEFAGNIARLAQQFEGPFLMGERMTIPDIIMTHCLNWANSAKFPVEHENLLAYGKAMQARDAYKRAMEG